jgi:uncharacterized membrane protein YraQ (UPF0718 family)
MGSCCGTDTTTMTDSHHGHHHHGKQKFDFLLWISLAIIALSYAAYIFFDTSLTDTIVHHFTMSIFEIMNSMWWGILIGIFFVGLMNQIPSSKIQRLFGKPRTKGSILRATLAGVALDLCSHGILLVGMNLYKKGVGLGQVMAFLIASPWNSFSLTFILISLIGLPYTLLFIAASAVIAIISGYIFDILVTKKILPESPYESQIDSTPDVSLWQLIKTHVFVPKSLWAMIKEGISESSSIMRWLFLGVIISALVRVFVSPESFSEYFGPTALGMLITLLGATIIEVCSEGTTPLAADIVTRAGAPGNGFAFMMTGVSTDYTEIMAIKETTKSWKIALFLPLITLPQIIILGLLINYFGK